MTYPSNKAEADSPLNLAYWIHKMLIGVLWLLLTSDINYPHRLLDSFFVLRHAHVHSFVIFCRFFNLQQSSVNNVVVCHVASNFAPLYGGEGISRHLTWEECGCTFVNGLVCWYDDCRGSNWGVWQETKYIQDKLQILLVALTWDVFSLSSQYTRVKQYTGRTLQMNLVKCPSSLWVSEWISG